MVGKLSKVIWAKNARLQLKKIISFIKKDSVQNAENVRNEIFSSTKQILAHPTKFPVDKYKKNNKGNFRAYEIFHCRISYEITETQINIVRIRSTHQDTKKY